MRTHFHDFMLGIQAKHNSAPGDRVIESIAESISSETNLLALDELFVSDLDNSMMATRHSLQLYRLLRTALGVGCLSSSGRAEWSL